MLNVGVYDMSQLHSRLPLLCDSTKLVTLSSGSQAMLPGDIYGEHFVLT